MNLHIVFLFLLLAGFSAKADQYSDLKKYAKEVPTTQVTSEALYYIENETNESTANIKAHYTLALFEDIASGKSWYILDGYFELASGKILFLDLSYKPATKTWWPIENYKYYVPAAAERFMLQAQKICDPYKRNFIGVVGVTHFAPSIDTLNAFLSKEYGQRPTVISNANTVLIVDYTRNSFWGSNPEPVFTLNENTLVAGLQKNLGMTSEVLTSGREPSTAALKKTYAAVTESCK